MFRFEPDPNPQSIKWPIISLICVAITAISFTFISFVMGYDRASDDVESQSPRPTAEVTTPAASDKTSDKATKKPKPQRKPEASASISPKAIAQDYYTVVGKARQEFNARPGEIILCPLDHLERAQCAFAKLTQKNRKEAQARGRQSISVNPTGWPHDNRQVQIENYRGWFWNRSHMIADSLGGPATKDNLVTGTRTQNVGASNAHRGGMAYTETIARNYLDSPRAKNCPLYYAVVPNYTKEELIPRTVTIDIQSCNQSISQRVIVDNSARGWDINYTTGQIQPVK